MTFRTTSRAPRLALLLLRGLDHFSPDLIAATGRTGRVEARGFLLDPRAPDLAPVLAWTDGPCDALWFEFCWPPFPALIAAADFGGRRVMMRVHRIEAYGTDHAATAPWARIDDVIVVSTDMARRLRACAPTIDRTTRLHVIHNGIDLDAYRLAPARAPVGSPHRIGWCGWMSLHKNPLLALQILHRLRRDDDRYSLRMVTQGCDPVVVDSFVHLMSRMGLRDAVEIVGNIPACAMPEWHAENDVLLSTSVYESFGYAIAEAAAAGCDLAVLDYPGADEFWPAETRFATVDEAAALIRRARPGRWRELIESRFSLTRQADAVAELIAPSCGHRAEDQALALA